MGHGLFAKCPPEFLQDYVQVVDYHCKPLIRKAISDSPDVRALTKAHVARLRQCWLPRGDQRSWIHELAVDLFALWSCGPAFLAAMKDVTESPQLDPFDIESAHPPYELRIRILADCARYLGWEKEAVPLERMLQQWESRKAGLQNYNYYIALTPRDLTEEAITWALNGCRAWKIPRCDRAALLAIEERRRRKLAVNSAFELIVSAALLFEQDPQNYPAWESATVRSLCGELHGNA